MSTILHKLTAALTINGAMCDDCLSSSTAIKPRQSVNAVCRKLIGKGQLSRTKQQCPRCHAWKLVNVPVVESKHIEALAVQRTRPSEREALTRSKPWYWEGNVQGKIVVHLQAAGWAIVSTAHTESREAGKDIVATRETETIWISVKGWPEKSKNTQARHWFSGALFDLILYRTENPQVRLGIGIPAGFSTYSNLIPRVLWLRKKLPFDVYLVSKSGNVSVISPTDKLSGSE